ncbi:MAG: hypothetical protein WC712_05800 [Candidatus Brocadiia bacterium]
MARLTLLLCVLGCLMSFTMAQAEEPQPQTLLAKVTAMLSSTDEAYVAAREAIMDYIVAGGDAAKAEIAALPPLERFAALGAEAELRNAEHYKTVSEGFERAITLWSQGMARLGTTMGPKFSPLLLPSVGPPKIGNLPPNEPEHYYHPDSVVPDNDATRAFLMNTLAVGTRAKRNETGIILKRVSEYGDIRRWIALRLLVPHQRQLDDDVSSMFKDVCQKTAAIEDKGFFWSASAIAFFGSKEHPEFNDLFEMFALRLPYAIYWTSEDNSHYAKGEPEVLYAIPPGIPLYCGVKGYMLHPIGYLIEMAKEYTKGKDAMYCGPSPIYAPYGKLPSTTPKGEHPPEAPKPPAPDKPPADGAQLPVKGLAVAAMIVGAMVFQARRIGRRS